VTMPTTWTPTDVRRATDRFAAGLDGADPGAGVPGCPGWTVHDLVAHLGNTHAWATTIVRTGGPARVPEERPAAAQLRHWYAGRAAALGEALERTDPSSPCWNFAGAEENRGFWRRRQLHETLVHLVDLDQAHGRPTALSPATCADGIAEALEVFLPRMHARGFPADLAGPVSLVAADTGQVWTVSPVEGGHPALSVDGAPVADRVTGRAEDLLLRLWNRGGSTQVSGDADVTGRFLGSRLTA
jgi:uncharacterized protein (TIGR03083 family)